VQEKRNNPERDKRTYGGLKMAKWHRNAHSYAQTMRYYPRFSGKTRLAALFALESNT
jgi:hypothetical protein